MNSKRRQTFRLLLITSLLSIGTFMSSFVIAQAPPLPSGGIPCDGRLYFTRQTEVSPDANRQTYISYVTISSTGVASIVDYPNFIHTSTDNTIRTNATTYYNGYVFTQHWDASGFTLIRVSADGTFDEVLISSSITTDFNNAGIDNNGVIYFLGTQASPVLYKVDISNWPSVTLEQVTCSMTPAGTRIWGDIAIDPLTGKAYCWYHPTRTDVNTGLYEIVGYNTSAPTITKVNTSSSIDDSYTIGSLFFNERGQLFGYGTATGGTSGSNQTSMLFIPLETEGTRIKGQPISLSGSTATSQSDGCECAYRLSLTLTAGETGNGVVSIPNCTAPGSFAFNLTGKNNSGHAYSGITFKFDLADARFSFEKNATAIKSDLEAKFGTGIVVTISDSEEGGEDNLLTITNIEITSAPSFDFALDVVVAAYAVASFPATSTVTFQSEFGGLGDYYGNIEPSSDPLSFYGKNASTITFARQDDLCNSISGTVFNDVNGKADGVRDGAVINSNLSLYAVLVSKASDVITDFVAVNITNGTYKFEGVPVGTYDVILTTHSLTAANIGANVSTLSITPPTGWAYTGEQKDATPEATAADGILTNIAVTAAATISGADFGIQRRPETAISILPTQLAPAPGSMFAVFSSAFSNSTDDEDPDTHDYSGGNVSYIKVTAFPSGAARVKIGTVTYGTGEGESPWPTEGVTITYHAMLGAMLGQIEVTPLLPTSTVVIPIAAIDNAGAEDETLGSITIPFNSTTISGNVFNDPDAGFVNNSTGAANSVPTGIHANLLDGDNKVIATIAVNTDGSYTLPVTYKGDYTVKLSATTPDLGSELEADFTPPTGWVYTGGYTGTPNVGNNYGTDGKSTVIAMNSVTAQNNINFGIQQRPVTADKEIADQPNPGGTSTYTVTQSDFTRSDASGGTVSSITITDFPSDATSITIGTTTYYLTGVTPPTTCGTATCSNFPVSGGVAIGVNEEGILAATIEVDPIDGADVVVSIPFTATDNGGATSNQSPVSRLDIPFVNYSISGTIYNDPYNEVLGAWWEGGPLASPDYAEPVDDETALPAMYVVLFDPADDSKVLAVQQVDENGNYIFEYLNTGTYSLHLTKTAPEIGDSYSSGVPDYDAPEDWKYTITGNAVLLANLNKQVTNVNFGIQQRPETVVNLLIAELAPAPGAQHNIDGTVFINAIDADEDPSTEDYSGGSVNHIRFTAFPTGASSITINGTTYGSGTGHTAWPAAAGITVSYSAVSGVPDISVVPSSANVNVIVPIAAIDNVGAEDETPGSITIPFNSTTISGNVFNDPNAGFVNNSTGAANLVPTSMHANLLDGDDKVIATIAVNTDGSYILPVTYKGSYTVKLSATTPDLGSELEADFTPPTGWVYTGGYTGTPNVGNNYGTDGKSNVIAMTSVTAQNNVNFGIQQRPVTADKEIADQPNPGGTNTYTVTQSDFTRSDASGGTVSSITITAFPSDATSITIGTTTYYPTGVTPPTICGTTTCSNFPASGGVVIGVNGEGVLAEAINVDPIDGADVVVSIPFTATDNGGATSNQNPVSRLDIPFISYTVSGNVKNDFDGIGTGGVNGSNIDNSPEAALAEDLKAVLVDGSGNVYQTDDVNMATGTYSFESVPQGTYTVVLTQATTTIQVIGQPASTIVPTLPSGWVYTGEQLDGAAATANSGKLNGLAVSNANVSNADFGIQQRPETVVNLLVAELAPAPGAQHNIEGTVFINAIDADENPSTEDYSGGSVNYIRFTAFPAGASSITINGTTYGTGTGHTAWPTAAGVIVSYSAVSGVPDISVVPSSANVNVIVPIAAIDNAGAEDETPGSITIPFESTTISGNVFNDPDAGFVNNSTGAANSVPTGIHANLLDGDDKVIATIAVNTDGSYTLPVTYKGNYTVKLSVTMPDLGDALDEAFAAPDGWVYTGAFTGIANTGNSLDAIGISTSISKINPTPTTNVNFGINQIPQTVVNIRPAQLAPTPGSSFAVAGTLFKSPTTPGYSSTEDYSGGTVSFIRFTTLPIGADSIVINGIRYKTSNWPEGGVRATYNTVTGVSGISVYPISGIEQVVINIAAIDNGGTEDGTPGSITLPFGNTTVSGNVFNDPNAGNVNNSTTVDNLVPSGMYANLLNPSNVVIASVAVNADGTYALPVTYQSLYTVQLSESAVTSGTTLPASFVPPTGWKTTGAYNGLPNTSNTGVTTGKSSVFTIEALAPYTNVNFGIQELPETVVNILPSQFAPLPGVGLALEGSLFVTPLVSTNPGTEDYSNGTVEYIKFKSFPSGIDSIRIGDVKYTLGSWPSSGLQVPFSPVTGITGVHVYPAVGVTNVKIDIAAIDNGGAEDPTPGSITIPFAKGSIRGVVYNDPNAGNVNNSSESANLIPLGLYANLINEEGKVMKSVAVVSGGTYALDVAYPGNYTVKLTDYLPTEGATLFTAFTPPSGWSYTGAYIGAANTGNTGDTEGISSIINVATTDVLTNVNFGMQQLPQTVVNIITNDGGYSEGTAIPVPSAAFTAANVSANPSTEDYSGGIVQSIRFVELPTGIDSIMIQGITYHASNWPESGVVAGYTTDMGVLHVAVYPTVGIASIVMPIASIDNAGTQDPTPGSITLNLDAPLPLQLLLFTAHQANCVGVLNWKTGNEDDAESFEIEKSSDGKHFESIEKAAVKGDNSIYTFEDHDLTNGATYYRLKLIYPTGFEYSVVRSISTSCKGAIITVYPNPTSTVVNISGLSVNQQIAVVDVIGRKMAERIATSNHEQLNLENYASGIYQIIIKDAAGKIVDNFKLIKD